MKFLITKHKITALHKICRELQKKTQTENQNTHAHTPHPKKPKQKQTEKATILAHLLQHTRTRGRILKSLLNVVIGKQSWSQLWCSDLAFFFFPLSLFPPHFCQNHPAFCPLPAQFSTFVRQAQMMEDVHPSQSLGRHVFRGNPIGLPVQLFPQEPVCFQFPSLFQSLKGKIQ